MFTVQLHGFKKQFGWENQDIYAKLSGSDVMHDCMSQYSHNCHLLGIPW